LAITYFFVSTFYLLANLFRRKNNGVQMKSFQLLPRRQSHVQAVTSTGWRLPDLLVLLHTCPGTLRD